MKKWIAIILIGIMCIMPLSGCIIGHKQDNTPTVSNWYDALDAGLQGYQGAFDTRITKKLNEETKLDMVLAVRTNADYMKMRLDQYGSKDESLYGVVQDGQLYISAPKLFNRAIKPVINVNAAYNGDYFTTPFAISANANTAKKNIIMLFATATKNIIQSNPNTNEINITDDAQMVALLEAYATVFESNEFQQNMLAFTTSSQTTTLMQSALYLLSATHNINGSSWTNYADYLRDKANNIANNAEHITLRIKADSNGSNLNLVLEWADTIEDNTITRTVHTIFTPNNYNIGLYEFEDNEELYMPLDTIISHIAFNIDAQNIDTENNDVHQMDSIPTYTVERTENTVICSRITPIFSEIVTYYYSMDKITNIEVTIETDNEMIKQAFYLKYINEGFVISDNDIPTEEPAITATPTVAPTPEPTAEPTDETDNTDNPTENPDDQPEITPEPTEKPEETVEPVHNTPSTSQTHHYTLTMHINEEALKQWQNAFETIDQLVYVLEHK